MDYYKVLEVAENADISEIKKKYRKLVMKYHPDRNSGSEENVKKFREITEAYEILGNEKKRKEYDYKRKNIHLVSKSGGKSGDFKWQEK